MRRIVIVGGGPTYAVLFNAQPLFSSPHAFQCEIVGLGCHQTIFFVRLNFKSLKIKSTETSDISRNGSDVFHLCYAPAGRFHFDSSLNPSRLRDALASSWLKLDFCGEHKNKNENNWQTFCRKGSIQRWMATECCRSSILSFVDAFEWDCCQVRWECNVVKTGRPVGVELEVISLSMLMAVSNSIATYFVTRAPGKRVDLFNESRKYLALVVHLHRFTNKCTMWRMDSSGLERTTWNIVGTTSPSTVQLEWWIVWRWLRASTSTHTHTSEWLVHNDCHQI